MPEIPKDKPEVIFTRGDYGSKSLRPIIHHDVTGNLQSSWAMALIERWGMVSGIEDGEDSAGRAKLRLSAPNEVVARACETAELAFQAFHERGWLVPIPSMEVGRQQILDQENADEKRRNQ